MTEQEYQDIRDVFQKARAKGFYQENPEQAALLDEFERAVLVPDEEFTEEQRAFLGVHMELFAAMYVFCLLRDI